LGGDPPVGSSTAFKDAGTHLARHDRQPFLANLNLVQLQGLVAAQGQSHLHRNHSTRLTFLSLHKSTLVESVLDPSA
jgi:hypothetical protein